jgi:hypothetical protein
MVANDIPLSCLGLIRVRTLAGSSGGRPSRTPCFRFCSSASRVRWPINRSSVLCPRWAFLPQFSTYYGRPSDPATAALFYSVRLIDGFEVTRDNVRGALPALFESAGLEDACER